MTKLLYTNMPKCTSEAFFFTLELICEPKFVWAFLHYKLESEIPILKPNVYYNDRFRITFGQDLHISTASPFLSI